MPALQAKFRYFRRKALNIKMGISGLPPKLEDTGVVGGVQGRGLRVAGARDFQDPRKSLGQTTGPTLK